MAACMQRELVLKASFTSITSGKPKETCRFFLSPPRRLSLLTAGLPPTYKTEVGQSEARRSREDAEKLPSEFVQGAAEWGGGHREKD